MIAEEGQMSRLLSHPPSSCVLAIVFWLAVGTYQHLMLVSVVAAAASDKERCTPC